MLKKLTEEKREEILEAGIEAFAESGLHGAGMADIARRAGISVGVLYKYYVNKEDFFHACLRHSLTSLEDVLRQVTGREDKLLGYAGQIIRALQDFSRDHGSHIRMYHQITTASGDFARRLAEEIEGVTARLYTDYIARAQARGGAARGHGPPAFRLLLRQSADDAAVLLLLRLLQGAFCPLLRRCRARRRPPGGSGAAEIFGVRLYHRAGPDSSPGRTLGGTFS